MEQYLNGDHSYYKSNLAFMTIIECKNQKNWDNFAAGRKRAEFLHSWGWGELQEKEGRKVRRMAVLDEGQKEILAVFVLIKMPLVGNYYYFYTPRGPIFKKGYDTSETWNKISEKIKEAAAKENIVFWRFEPIAPAPSEMSRIAKEVAPVQPKNTLILNLEDSEENLLKKMHSKTRYNIKLAQKKGVRIKEAENAETGIKIFWEMLNKTAERQDFVLHNRDHYSNIIKSRLHPKLFFAFYEDRAIAANLNINYGDVSVYLHGASADELQNLQPAALLQWEAIRSAKRAGCKYYDFWGINKSKCQMPPKDKPTGQANAKCQRNWNYKKEWEGITRFKTGFGGQEINFPGTFDFSLNMVLYNLYKLYKKFK